MSGPWEQFASATPAATGPWARFAAPQRDTGMVDNLVRSAASGASLGLADEIAAAGDAAVGPALDWALNKLSLGSTNTSTAPSFSERYTENLGKERGQDKAFSEAHPYLDTAGKVAGGVASTVAALPAWATAAAPTMLGNMAKVGLTGAVLGGATGFGEGEGGVENRLAHAILPAAVGAGAGALAPVAGAGVRAAAESAPLRYVQEKMIAPLLRMVTGNNAPKSLSAAAADGGSNIPPPRPSMADSFGNVLESGAVDRLATALQRAQLTPQQVERRLGQLGPESVMADTDPQLLSVATGAKVLPGQTRTLAENVMTGRDRQAGPRLVSAFEGDQPPKSSFALRGEGQEYDQNLRAVGQRAYGDMEAAGLKQTPELIEIQQNPIVSRALDTVMNVERQTRQGTNRAPSSPIEIMHKVKQTIWDMGFDANTARPGPNASYYRDLGTEYMNRLKAANPALAEADRAYAQAASLPEHFDAGRALLSRGSSEKATQNSAPALADLLSRADPQQALAARAGATNAARETALEGTRPARALAQRIDESAPVRNKLTQLYGPQQGSRIMQQASNEMTFANTSNKLLRGSQTAEKTVDALDLGNTQLRLSPSGIGSRLLENVGDFVTKISGPNQAVRDAIGRATLATDPAEKRRILALVAALMERRAAGRPITAGLIEGTSGQFGGP